MKLETFFLDTYGLIEIIHGNENYKKFTQKVGLITTALNLMELYYYCLRNFDRKTAEKYYKSFESFIINYDSEEIKKACEFKLENKKHKISFVDCIGYIIAKSQNVKFVTGDMQFENFENVEYLK
jgi:uncharacterized protein